MKWSPQPKDRCARPDCDQEARQWTYCEPHGRLFRRNGTPYRQDEIDEQRAANKYEQEMDEALAARPPVIVWVPNRRGVSKAVVLYDPHTERANRKVAS